MIMNVKRKPGKASLGWLLASHLHLPCALGHGGIRSIKREGDGATPAGLWPLRCVLYRADRIARPQTALPLARISPGDGWCDAQHDRNYNRPVNLPYPGSHERLWRTDHLYDLIVVLGYNDLPRRSGCGSAIFMHVARPNFEPTEGCIALCRTDLVRLLCLCKPGSAVRVHG